MLVRLFFPGDGGAVKVPYTLFREEVGGGGRNDQELRPLSQLDVGPQRIGRIEDLPRDRPPGERRKGCFTDESRRRIGEHGCYVRA